MKQAESLKKVLELQGKSVILSKKISKKLKDKTLPVLLLPVLKEQVKNLSQIQLQIGKFKLDKYCGSHSELKEEVENLKTKFSALVKNSEDQVLLASKKGIRLTGTGGKPYSQNYTEQKPRHKPTARP